jgi:predicted XRE-type DNA-binding protein
MTGQRFANVWDALEDTPAEAQNMRLRSSLMMQLRTYITRVGMTQGEAARLFGVTQPRVSDLMRGKVDVFAIDALVNMAAAAGLQVDMQLREAA